jgi:hypothetical protein
MASMVKDKSTGHWLIAGLTWPGPGRGRGRRSARLELACASLPDVVMLNLMPPGIDGTEACRRRRTFSDALTSVRRREVGGTVIHGATDLDLTTRSGRTSTGYGFRVVKAARVALSQLARY